MDWPSPLIRDIACRRAVLFFGSGVSMNSVAADDQKRPRNWWDFLQYATTKVSRSSVRKDLKELLKRNDLLTACEVIKREIKRDAFIDLMKEEFQQPGYKPAPIHEHLWKLDLRITITPNFDSIYDTLVAQRGAGTVTVKTYQDDDIADALRCNERVLIKSHGTITQPDKLIFTRTDYAAARSHYRDFYDLINSLLRTHTFLFIGCGVDDPDIRSLLEDYCYRHQFARKHYFVMPNKRFSREVQEVLQDSLKLDFISYDPAPNHEKLTVGLEALATSVERERDRVGKTQTW